MTGKIQNERDHGKQTRSFTNVHCRCFCRFSFYFSFSFILFVVCLRHQVAVAANLSAAESTHSANSISSQLSGPYASVVLEAASCDGCTGSVLSSGPCTRVKRVIIVQRAGGEPLKRNEINAQPHRQACRTLRARTLWAKRCSDDNIRHTWRLSRLPLRQWPWRLTSPCGKRLRMSH